jgi:hypothetical protein
VNNWGILVITFNQENLFFLLIFTLIFIKQSCYLSFLVIWFGLTIFRWVLGSKLFSMEFMVTFGF